MMKKRSTVDLPEDLIAEILSRVPAISLARFRAISKGWNSLIKDGRFAKTHFSNAIMLNNFRVYLLNLNLNGMHDNVAPSAKITSQFSLKDPLNNSSEADIRDVFHCDGLLLCVNKDDRLVVLNPCSGETKWIQPRNFYRKFAYYAFGKSSYNKYKILRWQRNGMETEYRVYDSASNLWKSIYKTKAWYIRWTERCGVFFKGSNYWVASNPYEPRDYLFLLSFDFSTEKFQRQSIPRTDLPVRVAALSVVREEKLCLLLTHRDTKTLHVWMATKTESTGVMSWCKFLTANPSYELSYWTCFLADEQNKVVVCCDYPEVPNNILHIVGEDRYIQVDHHGAESSYSCLLNYVLTLVQIPQVI